MWYRVLFDFLPVESGTNKSRSWRHNEKNNAKSKKNKKNNNNGVVAGIYSVVDDDGEALMIIVLDKWLVGNNRWAVGGTDGLSAVVVVSQVDGKESTWFAWNPHRGGFTTLRVIATGKKEAKNLVVQLTYVHRPVSHPVFANRVAHPIN